MQKVVEEKPFGSDAICLRLPGLAADNIMFDRDADGNPVITGVIGWGDSIYVVTGLKEGESILRTPNPLLTAITAENEEIKRVFTEAIGEDWIAEAEDERLALARALVDFSRDVVYPNPTHPPVAKKEAWKAMAEGIPDIADPEFEGKLQKVAEAAEGHQELSNPLW
ncbi:hypothetical protein PG993_012419 [Apiospora rasikravindrae]|uniref:Uncharacterized protein n=1 Tax=Apiospora rasikravindrae TaxID=990691 RepID=A0ABR1S2V6_9PEZI